MAITESISLIADLKALLCDTSDDQTAELRQLRLLVSRQLDISPEATAALFDGIRGAQTTDDLVSLLAQSLGHSKATTALLASTFAALVASKEHAEALKRLTSIIDTLLKREAPLTIVDQVAAIATAQKEDTTLRYCLDGVPVADIYIPQRFRNLRTERTASTPREAGVTQKRPIVISAPYGHGKSTFLRGIATLSIDSSSILEVAGRSAALPLYFNATDLADLMGNALNLWPVLQEYVSQVLELQLPTKRALQEHGAVPIIIIDGLDEFTEPERAYKLLKAAFKLQRQLSKGLVVIGARSDFTSQSRARNLFTSSTCTVLQLLEFSNEEQDRWIDRWNQYCTRIGAPMFPRDATNGTDGNRLEIYATPLLLLLHAAHYDGTLTAVRPAELYERLISSTVEGKASVEAASESLLTGAVDRYGLEGSIPGRRLEKRRLLQEAAFLAIQSNTPSLSTQAIKAALNTASVKAEFTALRKLEGSTTSLNMEATLRQLRVAHFFAQGNALTFVHRSFAEYLCAERYFRPKFDKHGQPHENEDDSMLDHMSPVSIDFATQLAFERRKAESLATRISRMWIGIQTRALSQKELENLLIAIAFCARHCRAQELPSVMRWLDDVVDSQERAIDKSRRLQQLADNARCTSWKGRHLHSATWKELSGVTTFQDVQLTSITFDSIAQVENDQLQFRNVAASELAFTRSNLGTLLAHNSTFDALDLSRTSLSLSSHSSTVTGGKWTDSAVRGCGFRNTEINHVFTTKTVFDGSWRHVTFRDCTFDPAPKLYERGFYEARFVSCHGLEGLV